jgi:hypothetical protein
LIRVPPQVNFKIGTFLVLRELKSSLLSTSSSLPSSAAEGKVPGLVSSPPTICEVSDVPPHSSLSYLQGMSFSCQFQWTNFLNINYLLCQHDGKICKCNYIIIRFINNFHRLKGQCHKMVIEIKIGRLKATVRRVTHPLM